MTASADWDRQITAPHPTAEAAALVAEIDRVNRDLKRGVGLIAVERQRQIEAEGWTPEHDDEHDDGVLVRAAICYADKAATQARGGRGVGQLRPTWPWDHSYWKPADDPVRNLVKAGALIAAEIDRLIRNAEGAS